VIQRILALIVIGWALGFVWFVTTLPGAAHAERTDAIVVLTGGKGRIERGIAMLEAGRAKRMFVSGVDPSVRAVELAAVQKAPPKLFACCIDLGKQAIDTQSNATETASWLSAHHFTSARLITNDWHMARARFELERVVDLGTILLSDAVETEPSLAILFVDYNKLIARRIAAPLGL
jgi:uncharacterized SAM-binding protein YcdF (DUF218 family)